MVGSSRSSTAVTVWSMSTQAEGVIVPGYIDVQINGAHGIDVTTQPDRIDELGSTSYSTALRHSSRR